jgi:hypothetical protein
MTKSIFAPMRAMLEMSRGKKWLLPDIRRMSAHEEKKKWISP